MPVIRKSEIMSASKLVKKYKGVRLIKLLPVVNVIADLDRVPNDCNIEFFVFFYDGEMINQTVTVPCAPAIEGAIERKLLRDEMTL